VAQGVQVTDDLVVTGNIVLQPGDYFVDDANADGVIKINADNVTLDGTGVRIIGPRFRGFGIRMNGHSGLTLRNFDIRGYDYGIAIDNAFSVVIEQSNISGNRKDVTTSFLGIGCGGCYGGGILFRNVNMSLVRGNTLTNQSTGLEIIGGRSNTVYDNLLSEGPACNELRQNSCFGIRLDGSAGNLIRGNVADYVDRVRYGFSSGDSAGLLLVSGAHGNQIISNSFTHSGDGFFLGNLCARASNLNYVYGNDGSFSPNNAFEATFSTGNVFDRNWANDSNFGFWMGYSFNSRVTRNLIDGNRSSGIAIEHGRGNEIDRNALRRNSTGIELWAADTTCAADPACGASCPSASYRIRQNNVTLNTVGLSVESTAGAAVSRNQLVDNGFRNVRVAGTSTGVDLGHNNLDCRNNLGTGSANLAFQKAATASTGAASAPKAVDGTVFVDGSAWVPVGELQKNDWWQVDLGASRTVAEIAIYPYFINLNDFPYQFHIEVSATGAFAGEQVRVVTETSRPLRQPLIYGFTPVQGRFVRLISDELRGWVQMMEFAVFAQAGQTPAPCQTAVANEMAAGSDVNAVRASWGTLDAAAISASIHDRDDDPARGRVLFQPFLREPVPAASGTFDPGLGAWSATTPLPQASAAPFLDRGQQLIVHQGFVYLFGGQVTGNTPSTAVLSGRLRPDGSVVSWTATTSLPGAFNDQVAVRSGSWVYLITGASGATAVYRAPLLANGGVGAWSVTAPLLPSRQSFAAVAYGGRLYATGGNSGGTRNFVKIATVQADGSLSAWQDSTPLPEAIQGHAMVAYDGFLFVIAPSGRVWRSALQNDGTAGAWQAATALPALTSPAAFENDGTLYAVSGAQVRSSAIASDGTLGAWQSTTPLPQAVQGLRIGAANGFVYAAGGFTGSAYVNTVRFAPFDPAAGCQGGEVLTAPFRNGFGGATSALTYQGLATVFVTGVGQASGQTFSDAFYLFAQGDGTPIAPVHPNQPGNWVLALNSQPIEPFLVDGLPAYRPDHRYLIRLRLPAGRLTFGVADGATGDNTGQYTIGLCGGTP
jgi:parallel beta-helix repeat protein